MEITFEEFLVLAKRYQAMGTSTQTLLDGMRKGNYKEIDGVRLRQLYEFLRDIDCFQTGPNEVFELMKNVEHIITQHRDEEEQLIVSEKWVPEKGFPGATLWLQREDLKWTIAPSAQEGACIGKCVKDLGTTKWFDKPLPLLIGGSK